MSDSESRYFSAKGAAIRKRLREFLEASGISQQELNAWAKRGHSWVSDILRNKSSLPPALVHRLAEKWDLDPRWLFTGKGPPWAEGHAMGRTAAGKSIKCETLPMASPGDFPHGGSSLDHYIRRQLAGVKSHPAGKGQEVGVAEDGPEYGASPGSLPRADIVGDRIVIEIPLSFLPPRASPADDPDAPPKEE